MDSSASTTATTGQAKPQWARYETLARRNAYESERSPALFLVIIVDRTEWYKPIHCDVEVMLTGLYAVRSVLGRKGDKRRRMRPSECTVR